MSLPGRSWYSKAAWALVLYPLLALFAVGAGGLVAWRLLTSAAARQCLSGMRRAKRGLRASYPDIFERLKDTGDWMSGVDSVCLWVLLKGDMGGRVPKFFEISMTIPNAAKRVFNPEEIASYDRLSAKMERDGSIAATDPEFNWSLLQRYLRNRGAGVGAFGALTDPDIASICAMQTVVHQAFRDVGCAGEGPQVGFETAQRVNAVGALQYFA